MHGNWVQSFWWWVEVHTGIRNEAGPYYAFWSGFGSCLGYLAIFSVGINLIRTHNCDVHGCFSFRSYPVEGTPYKTCKRHHPAMSKGPTTAEEVKQAHALQNEPEKIQEEVAKED
jgi:hypothetical protein